MNREEVIKILRDAAKNNGLTKTARDASLDYQGMHKMMRTTGNPTLNTILSLCKALDLELKITIRGKDA